MVLQPISAAGPVARAACDAPRRSRRDRGRRRRGHVPAVGVEARRHVVGEPASDVGRRSRCRCRRRSTISLPRPRCRRASTPRGRCLPSGSRRRRRRRCGGRRCRGRPVEARAPACCSASAMPTALARPWPSGPVVVSMPTAWPCSGWPAVRDAELAEALQLVQRQRRSRSGGAAHRAASSRGRPTARSGRGPASADRAGRACRKSRPQHVGDVGHAHRHAGMAGLGLLDRVHGERADGIGEGGLAGHGLASLDKADRKSSAT